MHSYVYQVSLQPVQSEAYAKAGHLPDWFYEQVCSYAENADPAWREQAIQELVQFLGPLCTRTGSRLTFSHSLRDGFSAAGMSASRRRLRCWPRRHFRCSAAARLHRPSTWRWTV